MNSKNNLNMIFPTETRRNRKRALNFYIEQIIAIRDSEERYLENIPENLQGSANYEIADEAVSVLDEIIDLMYEVYP